MAFEEGVVEADGIRIRYQQAGEGEPLVHVCGTLTPAHELLSRSRRVIVLPAPASAKTMSLALAALGVERATLWGGSAALALAVDRPEVVEALVLESPGAPESPLEHVEARTLVLAGTEDRASPAENGGVYRERMKRCTYILVYGAGRAIAADRPEAFAGLVADFMDRQERFIVSDEPTALYS